MGIAERPYIYTGGLFHSVDFAIPFFCPVAGLKNKLPPAVKYPEVKVICLDGIIRIKKIIEAVSVGRKGSGHGNKAIVQHLYIFLHTVAAAKRCISSHQLYGVNDLPVDGRK